MLPHSTTNLCLFTRNKDNQRRKQKIDVVFKNKVLFEATYLKWIYYMNTFFVEKKNKTRKKLCQGAFQKFSLKYLSDWLWMTSRKQKRKWRRKRKSFSIKHCDGRETSRYLELIFLLMTRLKCRSHKLSHDIRFQWHWDLYMRATM